MLHSMGTTVEDIKGSIWSFFLCWLIILEGELPNSHKVTKSES